MSGGAVTRDARSTASSLLLGLLIAVASASLAHAQETLDPGPTIQAGGNINVGGNINFGMTKERAEAFAEAYARGESPAVSELASVSRQSGVADAAIASFFESLGQQNVPPERYAVEFAAYVQKLKEQDARLALLRTENPEVDALIADARKALAEGRQDEARSLFEQVEKAADGEAKETEKLFLEAKAAFEQDQLLSATAASELGELDMLQLDFSSAAEQFERAGAKVPETRPDLRPQFLERQAYALYREGFERGDLKASREAVALRRRLVIEHPRESEPMEWGLAQQRLANALVKLGQFTGDASLFTEAVNTFRSATEEVTREAAPIEWGLVQNDLAIALFRRGSPVDLKEAIDLLRSGLEEVTPERDAPKWTIMQTTLGQILATSFEQGGDRNQLKGLIEELRAGLAKSSREKDPLGWGLMQYNLGIALAVGSRFEPDTLSLHESVVALKAGLEETPRDKFASRWASMQAMLGRVTADLGRRERKKDYFAEATTYFRAALGEITHKLNPGAWAQVQVDLGAALTSWGEFEADSRHLREAVTGYEKALIETPVEIDPDSWLRIQTELGVTLGMMGKRDSDIAALNRSAAEFQKAVEVASRNKSAYYLMMLNNNLGNVYVTLGSGETGSERFAQAADSYRAALAAFTAESDPANHAYIQVSLGEALLKAAERDKNLAGVEEAIAAFRIAEEIYAFHDDGPQLAETRTDISAAEALRARLN